VAGRWQVVFDGLMLVWLINELGGVGFG
jgi:hypothetical protein